MDSLLRMVSCPHLHAWWVRDNPSDKHRRRNVKHIQYLYSSITSPHLPLIYIQFCLLLFINCFLKVDLLFLARLQVSWDHKPQTYFFVISSSFPVFCMSSLASSWSVVVHLLCHAWLFANPWTAACPASLSFTITQCLLRLMSIELMMPSSHIISKFI